MNSGSNNRTKQVSRVAPKDKPARYRSLAKVLHRLNYEFRDLALHPVERFTVHRYPVKPLKWHIVYVGRAGTPFEGGEYHGDIIFKNEFPVNPPLVRFNTYNGRLFRGDKVAVISARWWNSSMSVRQVLETIESIFEFGTPRPSSSLFEERYRLRMLAERSKFTGCSFCRKRDRLDPADAEYVSAFDRWQIALKDNSQEGIGDWWHQLREIVINNEERELVEISKRNYDSCIEKASAVFNSYLIVFNWRSLARHVLAPIIYRFFLMAELIIAYVTLIMICNDSLFPWSVRVPGIIDLVAMSFIAVQETSAIYAFILTRQQRGTAKSLARILGNVALGAVVSHIILAIIIACEVLKDKYDDRRIEAILYVAFAFGNDFYHYTMGVLFYLNTMFYLLGKAVESLKLCIFYGSRRKKPKAAKYDDISGETAKERTCQICKDELRPGEDVYVMACNAEHIYHRECVADLAVVSKKCPMCKAPFEVAIDSPPQKVNEP